MADKLYYTIGEVSEMLGEAASTLRFWESELPQLHPTKNSRGARCYTEKDIDLLRRVQHLTRQRGFTLEGVRDHLRTRQADDPLRELQADLVKLRQFLVELKEVL